MSENKLLTRKYLDSEEAREKFKIGHQFFDGKAQGRLDIEKVIDGHGNGRYTFTYSSAELIIDHHLLVSEYPTEMHVTGEEARHIEGMYYHAIMIYHLTNIRMSKTTGIGVPGNSVLLDFELKAVIEVSTDERNNPDKVANYAYGLSINFRDMIYPLIAKKLAFLDNNVVLTPKLVVDLGLGVNKFIFNSYSKPTDGNSNSFNECIYSMDLDNKSYILGIEPNVYDVVNKSMNDHLDDPINTTLQWTCVSSYEYLSLLKINPSSYKSLSSYKKVEDLSILQERRISGIRSIIPNGGTFSDISGVDDEKYTISYTKTVVDGNNKSFIWDVVYTISKNDRLVYSSANNTIHLKASVLIRFIDSSHELSNLKEYLSYHGRAPVINVSDPDPSDNQYFLALAGVTFEP